MRKNPTILSLLFLCSLFTGASVIKDNSFYRVVLNVPKDEVVNFSKAILNSNMSADAKSKIVTSFHRQVMDQNDTSKIK